MSLPNPHEEWSRLMAEREGLMEHWLFEFGKIIMEDSPYLEEGYKYSPEDKEISEEFAGLFVHGGHKPFLYSEHQFPFEAFRVFSKKRYPIILFYSDASDQSDEALRSIVERYAPVEVIPIPQIKTLSDYSNFMIKEAFQSIPAKLEKILTFQIDGYLLKTNWEDFVDKHDFDYVGAPWRYFELNKQRFEKGNICKCPEKYNIPKDVKIKVGNGGFSFRKRSKMIEVSDLINDEDCNWEYDGGALPEDTFYSYFGFGAKIFKPTSYEIADLFSSEPYSINKDTFGFHRLP